MNFVDPAELNRILAPKSVMVSMDQTLAILDYIKDKPQLAHSRYSRSKEGRNQLKRQWVTIADLANNISTDCAQRTPDQWRAYFNSLKSKLKKKIKDMKAESVASGGGPAKKWLTDVENRLYTILGPDLEEGLLRVCDTTVSHFETEHQPSTSTAEVVEQDESSNSSGSESSDIVLYYPEDESGHADNPIKHTFQLASVVCTDQQVKPMVGTDRQLKLGVHSNQRQKPIMRPAEQRKPVIQSGDHREIVINSGPEPEPSVHSGQRAGPVIHSGQWLGPVAHCSKRLEAVVNSGQHSDSVDFSNQQPAPVVHRDHLKRKTQKNSRRRLRHRPNSEQNGGPTALREAMEGLLNLERMKCESKREATAAINRLAGAMEAIAKRLAEVYDYFDKYTFLCEMYDDGADVIVELVLNFFPFDNSCQVINTKKGINLLKRVHAPYLKPAMLQVGNIINVFSKLLLIKDCAPATQRTLFGRSETTFAMIKPVPPSEHGKILTFISMKGFRIVNMKNGRINKEFAMDLYSYLSGSSMLPIIIDYVTSGDVIGLELIASDAVTEWKRALGSTDPAEAAPGTLRKMYGENMLKNVAHGANSRREAKQAIEAFFGEENGKPRIPLKATFKNCTCCVIKPHAIIDGNVGNIIEHIATSDKFYVSALAMFSMSIPDAREFYEVYNGVLPAYETMCIQLAEGKCLALEVKCKDPSLNVVCEFRKLCGPRDPDLCRQLYPESIRALYGKTAVQNAVHCTDLPEDGELEVEYFFKLLANTSN